MIAASSSRVLKQLAEGPLFDRLFSFVRRCWWYLLLAVFIGLAMILCVEASVVAESVVWMAFSLFVGLLAAGAGALVRVAAVTNELLRSHVRPR